MLMADSFLGMPDAIWLGLIILATPVVKYWMIERPRDRMLATAIKGIEEVHVATNSMKDELVRVTGEAEHAKGKLEGEAAEKAKNP